MYDDRAEVAKVVFSIFCMALFFTVVISFIWKSDNERVRRIEWCEQHGGTWFHREAKCIDVHEIKVP